MLKSWILVFCIYFPKIGVPRILYLDSAAKKCVMKYLDFVFFLDEKQVTETLVELRLQIGLQRSTFLMHHVDPDYEH